MTTQATASAEPLSSTWMAGIATLTMLLREIAERLGVTKAAVYYHFPTKEDILASLLEDFLAQLDELIAWTEGQPRGTDTRRAALDRYAQMLGGPKTDLARFMQEGQTAIRELAAGLQVRKHFARFQALLAAPDESAEGGLRAQVALVALHLAAFGPLSPAADYDGDGAATPVDRTELRAATRRGGRFRASDCRSLSIRASASGQLRRRSSVHRQRSATGFECMGCGRSGDGTWPTTGAMARRVASSGSARDTVRLSSFAPGRKAAIDVGVAVPGTEPSAAGVSSASSWRRRAGRACSAATPARPHPCGSRRGGRGGRTDRPSPCSLPPRAGQTR